ncbi:hypothetical protein [Ectopseudomonas mendocina]|uniref:hypothetical protein n=1 Tax=Ectopseudomonas mendocina TaxID=300 RepID=UPI003133281C
MNILSSILYTVAITGLLLGSVALSGTLYLRSPAGVLLLFGMGLFMSLGFLLFGHLRFDETPDDDPEKPRCALKRMNPLKKFAIRKTFDYISAPRRATRQNVEIR